MAKINVGIFMIESKDEGLQSKNALNKKLNSLINNIKDSPSIPKNIKCNCGHPIKDHWYGGWCHSSGHPKEGQCGCTWFYPNDRYIIRKQKQNKK